MAVREIIEIDEDLCNGCGECVTACAEGAIQIIDGKARLISDIYCDGLGACLGHCPQEALNIIKRESEEFDEAEVERHLETQKQGHPAPIQLPISGGPAPPHGGGCPGARARSIAAAPVASSSSAVNETSQLSHWPVQMHLVPPTAPFFAGADVLLSADCVAYAIGGFHQRFLQGRALAIACPKLDSRQEVYIDKLVAMIDEAEIKSLTVMVMEVPCCSGLVRLVQQAYAQAQRKIPVECLVVSVAGQVLAEHQVA
jgi:NAD-dependent dihydropyrimidine dehydrogenase PreA subunit